MKENRVVRRRPREELRPSGTRTMPSIHHLNGIAHDIAHHAQSSLSCLHPHLANLCRILGMTEVTLDLLSSAPFGSNTIVAEPLQRSAAAVQAKFRERVDGKGLHLSTVSEARLTFGFSPSRDDYNWVVRVRVLETAGHAYEHTLPHF